MSVAFNMRRPEVPRELILVEDEPTPRKALTRLLKARGYEVVEAPTGDSAMLRANEGAVGVVLMDIRLDGDCDGIELAREIQTLHPRTSFIFVSAWAQEPMYHDRVREVGVRVGGWLEKPIDIKELSDLIEREQQRLEILAYLANARQGGFEPRSYIQALVDTGCVRGDVVRNVFIELKLAPQDPHELAGRIDAVFDRMQSLVEERAGDPNLPALLRPLEEQLEALEEEEAQLIQQNYKAHFDFNAEEGRSLIDEIEKILGRK